MIGNETHNKLFGKFMNINNKNLVKENEKVRLY